MKTFQSILVPVDGSLASLAALDHAVVMAQDYEAHVHLLHVMPVRDRLSEGARDEVEDAVFGAAASARRLLGPAFTAETIIGDPARVIIDYAREGFDLIVMGTHGWSGRMHALAGSLAETIVRNAPCPVLTVRDPGAGYQSFADRRHWRPSLGDRR